MRYNKNPLLNTKVLLLNFTKYFNYFDTKTTSDCRLLDSFTDYISFHSCNHSSLSSHKSYLESLDYLYLKTSFFSFTLIDIADISAILFRKI